MRKILFALLILISGTTLKAQKPELIESREEVIKQVTLELDQAMNQPEGALYKFSQNTTSPANTRCKSLSGTKDKLFRYLLPTKKMETSPLRIA